MNIFEFHLFFVYFVLSSVFVVSLFSLYSKILVLDVIIRIKNISFHFDLFIRSRSMATLVERITFLSIPALAHARLRTTRRYQVSLAFDFEFKSYLVCSSASGSEVMVVYNIFRPSRSMQVLYFWFIARPRPPERPALIYLV